MAYYLAHYAMLDLGMESYGIGGKQAKTDPYCTVYWPRRKQCTEWCLVMLMHSIKFSISIQVFTCRNLIFPFSFDSLPPSPKPCRRAPEVYNVFSQNPYAS